MTRPDINAKQMFFVGLLGLPWLWVVNVMYHWKAVYGHGNQNGSENARGGTEDENTGILDLMNDSENDNEQNNDAVPPELIQLELSKWIKRSTLGSFIYFTVLVSWIIAFQVNRDSFSPKWFVMSPEEEILTGW